MKLPRPTRTTLIFSLCLIALASVLAYENHQLSLVSNDLAATADKDSLNALLTRLTKVDERLDAVDGKHLVTNDDFRSGQQALSNRIDAVQAYAKQATETTQDLSLRVTAAEEQVMVVKASIEMIDIRLQELSKPLTTEPPVVAPPPKPVIRKKPQPAPQPPPFTVIGIEYRISRWRALSVRGAIRQYPAKPDQPDPARRWGHGNWTAPAAMDEGTEPSLLLTLMISQVGGMKIHNWG